MTRPRVRAEAVADHLDDAGVSFRYERRGHGSARGRPDTVVWVTPTGVPMDPVFPILVELEGGFNNVDDFRLFAERSTPSEPWRHHVNCGSWAEGLDAMAIELPYEILGIRASLLVGDDPPDEQHTHDAVREWCESFGPSFRSEATISRRHGTVIVWWDLEFRAFGKRFTPSFPFVLSSGEALRDVLRLERDRMEIPCLAVLTDRDAARTESSARHSTDVTFQRLDWSPSA